MRTILKSYVFVRGEVQDPFEIVEFAKKHLTLQYAAMLNDYYEMFLETNPITNGIMKKFSERFNIDCSIYTVKEQHGEKKLPYPKTLAIGKCNQPVRSVDRYLKSGVGTIETVQGHDDDRNVVFHIPKNMEESQKILNEIIQSGEQVHPYSIGEILYPEFKLPFEDLFGDKYKLDTDCVELVHSARER